MFARFSSVLSLILLLPACAVKRPMHNPKAVGFSFNTPTLEELRSMRSQDPCGKDDAQRSGGKNTQATPKQIELSHGDIPVPLGAKAKTDNFKAKRTGTIMSYSIRSPFGDLVNFYGSGMENNGWVKLGAFYGKPETVFLFAKSARICSISLRQINSYENQAVIVIVQKEEDYS